MSSPPCTCDPPVVDGYRYIQWIGTYFGDCIRTPWEQAAFWCGMVGLACFVVALVPQMWKNYKRQSVEGLSLGLLLIWALGDVTNFLGTILTNQTPTMKFTGAYFMLLSMVSFLQYFYYWHKERSRHISEEVEPLVASDEEVTVSERRGYGTVDRITVVVAVMVGLLGLASVAEGRSIMEIISELPLCDETMSTTLWMRIVGNIMAWISGLLYFSSRIPQLIQNHRAKSTEALSLTVFFLTIVGNVTYCLSIVLRNPPLNRAFFISTVPYLIGSAGTLVFDLMIFGQAAAYGQL
ncbi:hypothetical protein SpCBS45565_g06124 [Spizellomyces sp. 'palustris']|nr:hypothetical protein SpCBS45565_g06124 [Spizellomyces sp. 'palustris']